VHVKKLICLACLLVVFALALFLWLQWRSDEPRRQSLHTLAQFSRALDSGRHENLLPMVVIPPGLKNSTVPEQHQFLFKALRDEISVEGLQALKRNAHFGPLTAVFPIEAVEWAKQAGVSADQCMAFKLERDGGRAEVVLLRQDGGGKHDPPTFKIIRCNNVTDLN
jgi:hypothetical protein